MSKHRKKVAFPWGKAAIIGGIVLAVVIALVLAFTLGSKDPQKAPEPTRVPEAVQPTDAPEATVEPTPTAESTAEPTQAPEMTAAPQATTAPVATKAPQAGGLSFPYSIPNSQLVVEHVAAYEGAYLEDGSDVDVRNVTTLVVKNKGKVGVEYAKIQLVQGDKTLVFELSSLPAGARVAVQANGKAPKTAAPYTACTAMVAEIKDFEMSEDQVKVTENADGSLSVTNVSGVDIPCVRLFYKLYMDEEDAYVGGITYTAKIVDLKAGSTQIVAPSHYAAGYSRIMMVRTYATAD